MNPPVALELPPPPERVRLTGPLALIGAVPILLGFHPARSVVLLCVHGLRRRVGPVLRMDLPIPAEVADAAAFLAAQATRHATAVMLLCYSAADDDVLRGRPSFPHRALMDACLRELGDHGVPVLDAVLVRGGTASSYLRHTPADRGDPLPQDDDPALAHLRVAHVGAGRAVLGDREAVARAVAGPTSGDGAESTAAIVEAFQRFAVRIADLDHRRTVQLGCDIAHARLVGAVDAYRRGEGPIADAWADLVAVLAVDLVRDAVISWCLERVAETPVGLFVEIVRWTVDDFAVPVSTVLALVAYRNGDGALANVALDRALAIDPDYRLAVLVREFVVNGVHPTELDTLIIDWADHPGNPAAPFWYRRLVELDEWVDEGQE
jgi:hypothetical protein